MEWIILGAFALALFICIATGQNILLALSFGLCLFLFYGHRQGFSFRKLISMVGKGIFPVRNILLTFVFIGVLTALWRACGTIPVLVSYSARLIRPSIFLPMAFLLNAGVSFLTGTSFGTASTMGVICAAMGRALGVSPLLLGGSILSGAFFGDRCSPVSTSALLVASLTETTVYDNIPSMMKSARVPLVLSLLLYALFGFFGPSSGSVPDVTEPFAAMNLSPLALLPAIAILVLAALRVNIRLAMAGSILTALPLCFFLQGMPLSEILRTALWGYHPADDILSNLLGGGGILSMARVGGIVCLSASYSDLLKETGLLLPLQEKLSALAKKRGSFSATLAASLLTGIPACNQTLTILLTHQLCQEENKDKASFALDLEDTAVVIAPLIPWSIAGAVPLSVIGAPKASILASFYLILIPLYRLLTTKRV